MQSIFSALALHLFLQAYEAPPKPKPLENSAKKEVVALFEEYEKKRETKCPSIRARL
jgi:hypothetical protein